MKALQQLEQEHTPNGKLKKLTKNKLFIIFARVVSNSLICTPKFVQSGLRAPHAAAALQAVYSKYIDQIQFQHGNK